MSLYVAPDEFGDQTVWRHDPKRPDMPTALLSRYDVHPSAQDLWDHIVRGLPTDSAADASDAPSASSGTNS